MVSVLYRASDYIAGFYDSINSGLESLITLPEPILQHAYSNNIYFAKKNKRHSGNGGNGHGRRSNGCPGSLPHQKKPRILPKEKQSK